MSGHSELESSGGTLSSDPDSDQVPLVNIIFEVLHKKNNLVSAVEQPAQFWTDSGTNRGGSGIVGAIAPFPPPPPPPPFPTGGEKLKGQHALKIQSGKTTFNEYRYLSCKSDQTC